MKILVYVFAGLGTASLVLGAAFWIHGWTTVQRNREIGEILQRSDEKIAADFVWGASPNAQDVLPLVITNLRAETLDRGRESSAYSKAVGGFALMFAMLAVIVWRRQQLRDIERVNAEAAVPSRREVSVPQTPMEVAPQMT